MTTSPKARCAAKGDRQGKGGKRKRKRKRKGKGKGKGKRECVQNKDPYTETYVYRTSANDHPLLHPTDCRGSQKLTTASANLLSDSKVLTGVFPGSALPVRIPKPKPFLPLNSLVLP